MGVFTALLSSVFSTSKDVISKKMAARIDGASSTFASFAFALPFYLIAVAILWLYGFDIFTFSSAFWWLVLARALTDSVAEGLKMYAFAHGDISLVTLVFSLSPLFLIILSLLLTDDKLSVSGVTAVVVVVLGSQLLVWRPSEPGADRQRKAIALAFGASLFFALNSICDRLAVQEKKDDPVVAVVAAFTMTGLSSVLLVPFVAFRKDRLQGLATYHRGLLLRGSLEMPFMICKLLAMLSLPAVYAVGLQRSSMILSVIAGRVLFKESDFGRRLAAAFLILAGVLWMFGEQTPQ